MYCLSAKYSDAQATATEPGSCPLELLDSPEPEFTATAHGDGSVGNSFIAIDFKNCYTNKPSNTTGQPFMAPGAAAASLPPAPTPAPQCRLSYHPRRRHDFVYFFLYTGPYYKAFYFPATSIGRSARLFLVIQKFSLSLCKTRKRKPTAI